MISTIQNFNVNNRDVPIDLKEVPSAFWKTREIVDKIDLFRNHETLWTMSDQAKSVVGKIHKLSESVIRMKDAQDTATRDKVLGFLKSALVIAVVAATVIGTIAAFAASPNGALPALPLFLGIFSYFAVTYWMGSELAHEFEGNVNNEGAAFFCLLFGPILPIIHAFTKISSRKEMVNTQTKQIETDIEKVKLELPRSIDSFKNHYEELRMKLDEEIQKAINALEQLRRGQIGSSHSLESHPWSKERDAMVTAREELATLHRFYQQLGV